MLRMNSWIEDHMVLTPHGFACRCYSQQGIAGKWAFSLKLGDNIVHQGLAVVDDFGNLVQVKQ